MKRITVCTVVGEDFERTKYILNSIVNQQQSRWHLLIAGKRKNIVSFEELFEIINYAEECESCNLYLHDKEVGEFYYYNYAERYARENGCNALCFMPTGVAFYDGGVLKRLAEFHHLWASITYKSLLYDEATNQTDYSEGFDNYAHGIIWKRLDNKGNRELLRVC